LLGAATTGADLSGSSDAQTAAAGLALVKAAKTGDFTQVAAAANGLNNTLNATNNVVTQLQNSGLVEKGTNTNIQNLLDSMLTVDASGARDINAAAAFAADSGYNKFVFDGKTYTLNNDNSAATIAQLEADALRTNTANNLKGGEFDGVDAQIAANAKANNTVIGNAEADDLTQAAALAKARNPTGTTFTFGGNTYTMGTSNAAVAGALNETKLAETKDNIKNSASFNEAFALARKDLPAGTAFEWFNPKTGKTESFVNATAAERPDLSTAVKPATDQSDAETQRLLNQSNALVKANAPNESSAETRRLIAQNEALDLAAAKQKADAAKAAINSVLGEGTASNILIQGLSNINQATGQTLDFFGGTAAAIGLTGSNNALTNAGQSVTRLGE